MKLVFVLIFFILAINGYSQDTIYLDKKYKKIDQKELAKYYRIVIQDTDHGKKVAEQTFNLNGKIKIERIYSNYYKKNKSLEKNTIWYENGQIHIEGNYTKKKKDGYFYSFWENGKLKRKDLYKKGNLVEGKCWNIEGDEVEYYDFEIQPEFPGGREALVLYLKESINYVNIPSSSKGQKIKISFYIDTDGSIVDVNLIKGADSITDNEAKKIIQNMPKWKPAIQDGKRVKVKRTLPLSF
ncbi:MAG: energy transducer TonB [Flavobacteriaceae bacterium]|nr:energy transducer TonB [Flavobacteriaceae bacterium]